MPSEPADPHSEKVTEFPSAAGGLPASGAPDADGFLIRLEEYEGPLDALLDLIKKQDIDIFDIPIVQITEQYLEAIRRAESLNFEVSAETVLLAATLIHIKSKMLLPTTPIVDEEDPEDPRDDLVQRLLEREKFAQAAQMLKQKRVVEENVWAAGSADPVAESAEEPELKVSLFDLVQTFSDIIERLQNEPVVELEQEQVSVSNRIRYLKNLLLSEDQPIALRRILLRQRTVRGVVTTFLALLEMVKAQAVELRQDNLFGEIVIQKHKLFDEAFRHGELLPASDTELEYSL